jgi:hypothetical protein
VVFKLTPPVSPATLAINDPQVHKRPLHAMVRGMNRQKIVRIKNAGMQRCKVPVVLAARAVLTGTHGRGAN